MRTIEITERCSILMSEFENEMIFRATILRVGKPDLDDFGPTPFAALENAIESENDTKA